MSNKRPCTGELPNGARWVSVRWAQNYLALGKTTMYDLLKKGTILSVRIGRSRKIIYADLERFAEEIEAKQQADD